MPANITAFTRGVVLLACLLPIFLPGSIAFAAVQTDAAKRLLVRGMALQKQHRTMTAIAVYRRLLRQHPKHARAHYEIGWSYWVLGRWDRVVKHWEQAKLLNFRHPQLANYLRLARRNLEGGHDTLTRVAIGTRVISRQPLGHIDQASTKLALTLIARFQHYNPRPEHPADHFDPYVFSPKSVRFHPNGRKAYVNALEGMATIVYDPRELKRRKRIVHIFRKRHARLFADDGNNWLKFPQDLLRNRDPNIFAGKPVESAFTHDFRYLWIPYYRRDFDHYSTMPSAVAIIDTHRDRIVRVMRTGPIPKYVAASPDGRWLAVIHWGNNTVGLIDVSSGDPRRFRHDALVTVGHRVNLDKVSDRDRDHNCGYCLRGAVFTRDGRYLLVARMGGGGIAVIDVATKRYLGTAHGMRPTPRHIILSPDGRLAYLALSFSGYVAVYRTDDLIRAARHRQAIKPLRETHTGGATRTIALSPDGRLLFTAVNRESKVVVLTAPGLTPLLTIPADSYPVGLDVSPDGRQLWVTAQGRKRQGGNSVMVYRINTVRSTAAAHH